MVGVQDPGGESLSLQLSLLSRSRRHFHTRLQQCSRGPEELEKNKGLIAFSGRRLGQIAESGTYVLDNSPGLRDRSLDMKTGFRQTVLCRPHYQ